MVEQLDGGTGTADDAIGGVTDVRQVQESLRLLVENVQDYAIFLLDPAGRVLTWNAGAERIMVYRAGEIVGHHFSCFYTPEDRAHGKPERLLRRAAAAGRVEDEGWRLRKDGSRFWASVVLTALYDRDGSLRGFGEVSRDLSVHRQAEEERLHLAEARAADQAAAGGQTRLAFLAEASAALARSLDVAETFQRVVDLIVPQLADQCGIDVLQPDGAIRRMAVAAADPRKLPVLDELQHHYPPDPESAHPVAVVLRTRQPLLQATGMDAVHASFTQDAAHAQLLRALGTVSRMTVPLLVRERLLGVLWLATAESGRHYGPADLTLAVELARRCAQAIENARLYHEAQQAIEVRDQFLAVASHELRTPLTSLKGFIQLAQRQVQREGGSDLLATRLAAVKDQADRLGRLISSLLDVSRLAAGRFVVAPRVMALVPLVERAVTLARELPPQRVIELEVEQHDVQVRADPDRLEQILSNLLENACKYSSEDRPVQVSVATVTEERQALIAIRDEGMGIAAEEQQRIFTPFYRGSNIDANLSGLGLGLYVAHELIRAHGGSLGVRSIPGAGSIFTLTLPLA